MPRTARPTGWPGARQVGLYGGIFAHSAPARDAFCDALRARAPDAKVCAPEYPPELGAVIHLLRGEGALSGATLSQLKNTYEEVRR